MALGEDAMMRVLFIAAEAVPFVKTGGLGEVTGSLPGALRKRGVDARVIIPKYGDIPADLKEKIQHRAYTMTPVGWRSQYTGVEYLEYEDVPYYFLDNEYYFKRPGYYGYYDDAERFSFFSRGVLRVLPLLDFKPHILHCHDWHTALVSVFLEAFYRENPFYQEMKTILTIHNLKYQGIFPRVILSELLDLSERYYSADKLEFHDHVNFLKGGIVFSQCLTTVSPSYAWEIENPFYGEGLDGLLRQYAYKRRGILNGIDYAVYDPKIDPFLDKNYGSPEEKEENKVKLQEQLGLPSRRKTPLVAMVSRLTEQKGLDLVCRVLEEILSLDLQMVILGAGEERFEKYFTAAGLKYPHKLKVILGYNEALAHKIYAASNLFLMPSLFEPCGLGQLIAMRYGSLPVVRETGGLKDTIVPYNEYTEEGNGFSFANYNAHELLDVIQRALSLYKKKKIWNGLMEQAMAANFSWENSAGAYENLYAELAGEISE